MSYTVAILDIDGTILDSNDAHAQAWLRALEQHGHIVAFHDVRTRIGMGGDKLLQATHARGAADDRVAPGWADRDLEGAAAIFDDPEDFVRKGSVAMALARSRSMA